MTHRKLHDHILYQGVFIRTAAQMFESCGRAVKQIFNRDFRSLIARPGRNRYGFAVFNYHFRAVGSVTCDKRQLGY